MILKMSYLMIIDMICPIFLRTIVDLHTYRCCNNQVAIGETILLIHETIRIMNMCHCECT